MLSNVSASHAAKRGSRDDWQSRLEQNARCEQATAREA
jgi:hypothetical protein